MHSDPFAKITDEKKKRLMSAALSEFAKNGFDMASTRAITQASGVSTGLLFYYFKDKKALFTELYELISGFLEAEFFRDDFEEIIKKADFFDRLQLSVSRKIELSVTYPEAYSLIIEGSALSPKWAKRLTDKVLNDYGWMFRDGVSESIRSDIDSSLAAEIIWLAFSAYSKSLTEARLTESSTVERIMNMGFDRVEKYIQLFRKCFGSTAKH